MEILKQFLKAGKPSLSRREFAHVLHAVDAATGSHMHAELDNFIAETFLRLAGVESPTAEIQVKDFLELLCAGSALAATPASKPSNWRRNLKLGQPVAVWALSDEGEKTKKKWAAGIVGAIVEEDSGLTVVVNSASQAGVALYHGPVDSADLLPPMKDRGITVAHLQAFSELCRRKIQQEDVRDPRKHLDEEGTQRNPDYEQPLDFDSAPTWLVVKLFVIPLLEKRLSLRKDRHMVPFVDVLHELFPDLGGLRKANLFASHSWSSCFRNLVDAFADFGPDASVWICCFAMTQDKERLELVDNDEVFAETLKEKDTQHVLVCDLTMDAVTRMWVLFELMRSHELKKTLHLRPLSALMGSEGGLRCSIQMSKADCREPHDRHYITAKIEEVGGVEVLNQRVRSGVSLAFQSGIQEARQASNSEGEARLRAGHAAVLVEQGSYKDAIQEVDAALAILDRLTKQRYAHRIRTSEALDWRVRKAQALTKSGEHRAALEELRQVQKHQQEIFFAKQAEQHLQLGEIQRRLGNFPEAEEEMQQAEDFASKAGNTNSQESILLLRGQLLSHHQWLHGHAQKCFEKLLALRRDRLGEDHADTALAHYNLAHTLRRQHKPMEALEALRQVLKVQLQTKRPEHLDVLNTRLNIGIALSDQGRIEEAVAEVEIVKSCFSRFNPPTPKLCIARVVLGALLARQGFLEKAKQEITDALDFYNRSKTDQQNEVAWALTNLALISVRSREFQGALDHLQKAQTINSKAFSPTHPVCAQGLIYLGQAYHMLGQADSAKENVEKAIELMNRLGEDFQQQTAACRVWAETQLTAFNQDLRAILPNPVELISRKRVVASLVCWKDLYAKALHDNEFVFI